MVRTEGPRSPYSGLVAGLHRQMSFASIRIGLYDSVKQFYTPKGADHSSIAIRILAGCTTGAMAVTCAQPTDVVKVRFQAMIRLGTGGERKYRGTMDAYRTIAREEGVRGLWKGTWPNITRNAIVNCAEMVTYDIIKEKLLESRLFTDNFPCHFFSAFGAGFCATVVASPVDVVKTRYMNAPPGRYRSPLHCMLKMVAQEGPTAFYKGYQNNTLVFRLLDPSGSPSPPQICQERWRSLFHSQSQNPEQKLTSQVTPATVMGIIFCLRFCILVSALDGQNIIYLVSRWPEFKPECTTVCH
ncbi:mitochondrial uncoupling protein 3 isoform X3 [Onychomys torridus]|nr:mitochondrial uncoupling protein 3 isoform X3 [Onychomys torridus]